MQPNEQQPVDYPAQQPDFPPASPQVPAQEAPIPQPEPVEPIQQTPEAYAAASMEQTGNSQVPKEENTQQQNEPTQLPQDAPVVWQDIEYIQHDQGPLWYVGFVVVIIVLIVGAVLLKAWTFIPLILVMAVALMIYSHRPPRKLNYSWSSKGLTINDQIHPAGEFRSFGVIQDGQHNALVLIPVKRFRPGLTVYFPAEIGEQLVDAVGGYLPMQELHLDAFDKIIRKLRI